MDTATDIAKESADLILLEKDLMVLEGGVIEGRKVFANIVKYIRMGASSNFGNMFSVLGASAFLPFLPMAPIQVLTNNLLYDFSQVPIPADAVDEEQVARPRPWNIGEIKRFILFIGPISSIFDYTTFFVMLYIFNCWDPSRASLFQTGWFVESLMTQTLIIHVIRTNKIPFLQSRASWALTATTLSIMAFGMWLPYSPLASALGFTHLPRMYWPILMLTLLELRGPYADHQSVAAAEAMDLTAFRGTQIRRPQECLRATRNFIAQDEVGYVRRSRARTVVNPLGDARFRVLAGSVFPREVINRECDTR